MGEKAVLLSLNIQDNEVLNDGVNKKFDKVQTSLPTGLKTGSKRRLRAVPVRLPDGSFVAKNVMLMPSYVNIGAYVVRSARWADTWATVGLCAQIGKNVHLSGGVGIGGVLNSLQAAPTTTVTTASSVFKLLR